MLNHMLKLLTLITNQHQQLDRQAERHVKESHPFIERRNYEEDYNEDFLFSCLVSLFAEQNFQYFSFDKHLFQIKLPQCIIILNCICLTRFIE